jgi:hypothetical protein
MIGAGVGVGLRDFRPRHGLASAPIGFERLYVRTATGFGPFLVRKADNTGFEAFHVRLPLMATGEWDDNAAWSDNAEWID